VTSESDVDHPSLELARRLLTHEPFGPKVELFVGGLPLNLIEDLPPPASARLLGSVLISPDTQGSVLRAIFDADGDPAFVLAAYQRQLKELGWDTFEGGRFPPHGGFVTRQNAENFMMWRGGHGPILRAAVGASGQQSVDLRVTLDWETPRHTEERQSPAFRGQERMPTLCAPAGVTVRPRGGGGGGGRWRQEAVAETDLAAGVLEAHFADQLAKGAWMRVDGRAEDVVAWSSWQLPGDDNWRGLLLVLALFGTTRRSLWLGIESDASGDEGGSSSSLLRA
jgi:hypothetical protein